MLWHYCDVEICKVYMLCYFAVFDDYVMLWVCGLWEWKIKEFGRKRLSARGPSRDFT